MKRIKVYKEGREGVYIVSQKDIINFLEDSDLEEIHCNLNGNSIIIGADWEKDSVIEEIKKTDKLAILTGKARINNMGHSLAVISNNILKMFDIGQITENDLDISTYPQPFSFSKLNFDTVYKMKKLYDGIKESEKVESWNTRVTFDGVEYIMFLNKKNENHRYLRSELEKYGAGEEFYFTKIDLGNKGTRYFIHPYADHNGEILEEPSIDNLYREATGDKSMTTTERTFLSSAGMLCKNEYDEEKLMSTYRELKKLFPRDLTPDQRNLLFTCSFFGGTVEDVKNRYESIVKILW